ncbi:phage major capsid protein [Mycobacterium kyorinense]|nr:phage major capsid protein [Mycobacterium kyorinense]
MNIDDVRRRAQELDAELTRRKRLLDAGRISAKAYSDFVDDAYEEVERLKATREAFQKAGQAMGRQEAAYGAGPVHTKAFSVGARPPSPLDITESQLKELYEAGRRRTPLQIEIGAKGFADEVSTKSPMLESGITGGLGSLPPVMSPGQFVALGYEPTRLFGHLMQAAMQGPSAAWLQHVGNTTEATGVGEGATKPDIGPQVEERVVYPQKLAALASISMEYFSDYPQWASWLPMELTRSLVNTESLYLIAATTGSTNSIPGGPVNATFDGWLNTSGTLTRSVGTDTPLDAVNKSFIDLRTGPAFAEPDLVVLHPSTWGALRREKDSMGRYLLAPGGPTKFSADGSPVVGRPDDEMDRGAYIPQGVYPANGDIWGVPVVETTQCPAGTGIVASIRAGGGVAWTRWGLMLQFNMFGDSQWANNTYSYRVEERIALTVPRPAALNIVTGLPTE